MQKFVCGGVVATMVLMLAASPVAAQDRGTISGQVVTDPGGQPMGGAQVQVVGTTLGSLTNREGVYTISNVPAGEQQIRVTHIGYGQGTATVTVVGGTTVTANISLQQRAVELDAIHVGVLTGQRARTREIGASVANIAVARDINTTSVTSFSELLAGRTEGLILQSVAGTVGTSQRIRIRGANSLNLSNEPLVYVDGVRVSNSVGLETGVGGQDASRLNDLNTNDVESIEVLKGPAATALYGTAAANGVLLITTKRGSPARTEWNAFTEFGTVEDRTRYPDNVFSFQQNDPGASVDNLFTSAGFLNTDAFRACHNFQAATGECNQDGTVRFNTMLDGRTTPLSTGNRDRQGLSVRGGSEVFSYFLSGDREHERGVIDFNTIERTNVRANLTVHPRDDLDISMTSFFVRSDLSLNSNDNSVFSPIINGVVGLPVFVPGEEGTGPFRRNFGFGWSVEDLRAFVALQNVNRTNLGVNLNYRPQQLGWLSLNFNAGMDFVDRQDSRTLQPGQLPIAATFAQGTRQSNRNNAWLWTVNSSAAATWRIRQELVSTTTLAGSYDQERFESTECFGVGVLPGTSSCSATSSQFSVLEDFEQSLAVAGTVRQQLGWRDRVFLEGSVRVDDTNAIGFRSSSIVSPSASVSYVISEEEWFPTGSALSALRLRGAWGRAGVRPQFRDPLDLLSGVSVTQENSEVTGVTLASTGNAELKTERVEEFELGFTAGLLDERLSLDFTYFDKTSKDALVFRQLAGSFGLTASFPDNVGQVSNKGFEVGLNAQIVNTRNVQASLNFTSTYIDNTLDRLGEGVEPIIFNRGNQRHTEGRPLGSFFQPTITFQDSNGDGRLGIADVQVSEEAMFLGQSLPKWSNTLNPRVTLFNVVQVSSLFDRRSGHKQLNFTESFRCNTGQARNDRGCNATGDPNASLEDQAHFIASRFLGSNAGFIEDASFIKWRELAVTLLAPEQLRNSFRGISNASLTFAGRNLKTWTDFTGLDPEINETGGSANFTQGEFNTAPPVRTLSVRLNLTF